MDTTVTVVQAFLSVFATLTTAVGAVYYATEFDKPHLAEKCKNLLEEVRQIHHRVCVTERDSMGGPQNAELIEALTLSIKLAGEVIKRVDNDAEAGRQRIQHPYSKPIRELRARIEDLGTALTEYRTYAESTSIRPFNATPSNNVHIRQPENALLQGDNPGYPTKSRNPELRQTAMHGAGRERINVL